jgi:protein SCO1/2
MSLPAIITNSFLAVIVLCVSPGRLEGSPGTNVSVRVFAARGVVREVKRDEGIAVIRHEAITNFMESMSMPFKVKSSSELAGLAPGDEVVFTLCVTDAESWIENVRRIAAGRMTPIQSVETAAPIPAKSILSWEFTNELGQAVHLNDFRGQALGVTFFYTRCPIPEFCPRLSKNFQMAQEKLETMRGAPTNWHLISVSFDTDSDSPESLRLYGERYHYDPAHWTFLTGSAEKIAALARACGARYDAAGGTINHNFRTLIINAAGRVQTVFPTGGDLSDQIVEQIIKGAGDTNSAEIIPKSLSGG